MDDNNQALSAISSPEIDAALHAGAWAAISMSGGADSSACAYAAIKHLDAIDHDRTRRIAYHADLGRGDWPSTGPTVAATAAALGIKLEVVRHGTHDMLSRWARRGELGRIRYAAFESVKLFGPWSGPGAMFCTSELKAKVLDATKKRLGGPVVSIVGLRRDESYGRRLTPIARDDTALSLLAKHPCQLWYPIAHWSKPDVFRLHAETGLSLHEAYSVYSSSRMSCAFCVVGSAPDSRAAVSAPGNHATYREMVNMEISSGFSYQANRWLGDLAPALLDQSQIVGLAEAKRCAVERRRIETAIPPALLHRAAAGTVPEFAAATILATVRKQVAALHEMTATHLTAAEIIATCQRRMHGSKP